MDSNVPAVQLVVVQFTHTRSALAEQLAVRYCPVGHVLLEHGTQRRLLVGVQATCSYVPAVHAGVHGAQTRSAVALHAALR